MASNFMSSLMKKAGIVLPTITPGPTNVQPMSIGRSQAFYWQQFLRDRPIAFTDVLYRCDFYLLNSSFLQMFMPMKTAVYNHGFRVKAQKPKEQERLDDWMADEQKAGNTEISLEDMGTQEVIELESNKTNGESVNDFAWQAFYQWLSYDNLVGMWIDGRDYPILLRPDRCLYSNMMGVETIRYQHHLSWIDIKQLPPQQHERYYHHPMIFLNPKYGEHWKILKRSPVGMGFGMPRMISALRVLGEEDSKEEGLNMMGWLARTVMRRHRLGHDAKHDSPKVMLKMMWNKEDSDRTLQQWSNVIGPNDVTSNFDHEVDFPWLDPKVLDKTVWEGSNFRLLRWCGPIGLMLYADGEQPFLADMALADCLSERQKVKPFIEMVINKAHKPPVPITIEWDESIFTPAQLRSEMLKMGALSGSVSPQTVMEHAGLDPQKEEARKLEAVDNPRSQEVHMPIYDPQHANTPAKHGVLDPKEELKMKNERAKAKLMKKTGKPKGTKDKS